jgi:hypothetical protein
MLRQKRTKHLECRERDCRTPFWITIHNNDKEAMVDLEHFELKTEQICM